MEKVYCLNCAYLTVINKCGHPSNILIEDHSSWYKPLMVERYLNHPSNINFNNTCQLYVKK